MKNIYEYEIRYAGLLNGKEAWDVWLLVDSGVGTNKCWRRRRVAFFNKETAKNYAETLIYLSR